MIKTDENLNISAESRMICTKPFWGGGRYIKLWSCQICHKIFLPDFELFISGGGGWGWSIELWSCQIYHKIFLPDLQFFIPRVVVGYIKLWSCQICHKIFFTRFPIFHSRGGGCMLNFGPVKSAIK